jgi:hypothetical protein
MRMTALRRLRRDVPEDPSAGNRKPEMAQKASAEEKA